MCDILSKFSKLKHNKFEKEFFNSSENTKPFNRAHAMEHTVQLLRHDSYCPISTLSY